MRIRLDTSLARVLTASCLAALASCTTGLRSSEAGSAPVPAEGGVALRCERVLTMDAEDRVYSPGVVLVRDGRIEAVGDASLAIPDGYEVRDHDGWAVPGMVDLHTHIHGGGFRDINDMVVAINCDLRASAAFRPGNRAVRRACAAGVTTLFGIPGSGTSIGGFGILYKTKNSDEYVDTVVQDPGGMKVAQTHNPERRAGDLGVTRAGLSWILKQVNRRARKALREDRFDLPVENLKRIHSKELPVLIHCAASQGVANTVRMWKIDYDTRCVVSHGSFTGWEAAKFAADNGVPVNHGPRTLDFFSTRSGQVVGSGQEFVEAGVPHFSLNTDSPVVPQEELFLQGSMSARLGADAYQMLRAVTIHPAQAFGIDDRVGSLEVGKDADVVLFDGDPLDPRSRVDVVYIDGRSEYDRRRDGQLF